MSVLATSALVTGANKDTEKAILDQVSCIYYPVQFQKDKEVIRALINSGSKINAMTLAYVSKLAFESKKLTSELKKLTAHYFRLLG